MIPLWGTAMLFIVHCPARVFLLFGRGGDSGRRHPLYPSDLLRWEGQQRYFATFDVCFPLGL